MDHSSIHKNNKNQSQMFFDEFVWNAQHFSLFERLLKGEMVILETTGI